MRQIPTEGEFCGECPCLGTTYVECLLYPTLLETLHPKRLPQCLADKPQVLPNGKDIIDTLCYIRDNLELYDLPTGLQISSKWQGENQALVAPYGVLAKLVGAIKILRGEKA